MKFCQILSAASMESCPNNFISPRMTSTLNKPPLQHKYATSYNFRTLPTRKCSTKMRPLMAETTSASTYQKFVHFALQETTKHTQLTPSPLQKNFSCFSSKDGKTELYMLSHESPKVRLLRSLSIEGSDGMQVLDFAIFPRAEFDLPIFCANFFTTPAMNIVVLDLNPLHDVTNQQDYKKKYYNHLIPLGHKYAELLPWGGKITTESMKFFSPIVIWTKFPPSYEKNCLLYSAFMDYLKVLFVQLTRRNKVEAELSLCSPLLLSQSWLELMDQVSGETDVSQVTLNLEAQHRYLTWRAEKDPGHQLLRRVAGETLAKEMVRSFLFNGVDELGSKIFIDYFPEYKCDDGSINRKRSMVGKSFESRPWNIRGEFIGNILR